MRVFIEGNIGVGKSTFIEYLKKFDFFAKRAKFIPEPVEKWSNFCGHNLLEKMYKQPTSFGTTFQMCTMLTGFQTITETANEKELAIIERSILSMKYVFIPTMNILGFIPPETCDVFNAWFDFIIENQNFKPDVIIYMKTEADQLGCNIKNRGRQEEEDIDIERLKLIDGYYDEWIHGMIRNGQAEKFGADNWIETFARWKRLGGLDKTIILTIESDWKSNKIHDEYIRCVNQLEAISKELNH